MEWQPIETAPKDGTLMFVCRHISKLDSSTRYLPEVSYFSDLQQDFMDWSYTKLMYTPTHWMPLPEPPEIKKPE